MTTLLKNTEALDAQFGAAHEAVQDIIELQEKAEGVSGQIGTVADTLFSEIVTIQKETEQSAAQIFNTLAYLSGHDYYQDEVGNPDSNGKKNNRGAPWPKGTLSTYRAQCQKAERAECEGGLDKPVSSFDSFKELRAEVNPREKKVDELLDLIKKYRKELSKDDAQHVDVDAFNYINGYVSKIIEQREETRREKEAAQIAAELARVKAEEQAAKAKEEATKQKPLTKAEAAKREAAQSAKASVKSNAKKRKAA
tara:strand:+ start:98 stop:856 length:759 start_codon:yes stop_codon:yes gene_type:complete